MAQPVWITPAGTLGSIPNGIFYQQTLLASTPTIATTTCTATSAATDLITCTSTTGIYAGMNVMFTLSTFGGVFTNIRYFVLEVVDSTHFSISATEYDTTPIPLSTDTGLMTASVDQHVYYRVIAGALPRGIQCSDNGSIVGTPDAVSSLQGVPLPVGANTVSKFTVRAYTLAYPNATANIADRTFELTVVVAPGPQWITPSGSIGTYYDSDEVDLQLQFTESFEPDVTFVEFVSGQLPGGLILETTGRLKGYIQPTPNANELPGYSISGLEEEPYDFLTRAQSKNYQFTLRVTNGRKSDLRTFTMFVYSRDQMSADDGNPVGDSPILIGASPWIAAGNEFVDGSETPYRPSFITNDEPGNLGIFRSANYFAYEFVGENYNNVPICYAIGVDKGNGLPPGLVLDPISGWYYGYIPDQGATENEYSFFIIVYQANTTINEPITASSATAGTNIMTCEGTGQFLAGQPIVFDSNYAGLTAGTVYYVNTVVSESLSTNTTEFTITGASLTSTTSDTVFRLVIDCSATTSSTNEITCNDTSALGVGQPLVFTGTGFGGITASPQTIYFVTSITSSTTFTVSAHPDLASDVTLLNDTGSMVANLILASRAYPYTMTITGAVDAEVTWLTDSDLGDIFNGGTSLFQVEAVNRGGRDLLYRLKDGAYNSLPQGLKLLPSGEIAGRVSFDTFSLDLGATTIDETVDVTRNVSSVGTTFDSTFTFTVNAYAPDTTQLVYKVKSVEVIDGGTGYSSVNPPTIEFSAPIGATAVTAQAGNVTVIDGSISSVTIANQTGLFNCTTTSTALVVGGQITVSGSQLGTGFIVGYTSPTTYYVTATNGSTNFVLSATKGGSPITTNVGTTTGMSFTPRQGIAAVEVAEAGDGYTSPATVTVTQGFGGTGADLEAIMELSGSKDVVSVFKTFTIRVIRRYNKPYQNLVIKALPPPNDRALVRSLLDNTDIFVPEYIFRPDDPYFGKSKDVVYAHAFGLAPDTLETYVSSLYENHYFKSLVLGEVSTAQALDAEGNIIYEVVYSKIVDNLVNDQGQSVNKIVTLPYEIVDPLDNNILIGSVYPNSLINMRDQVIDVVGQISTTLPLWMTSKQTNGRVLGFTPAWVICYTQPGRSDQIAYYIQTQFGTQLNRVDFEVDRYILDRSLSRNWDAEAQHWTPSPPVAATFDVETHYQFPDSFTLNTGTGYAVGDEILILGSTVGGVDVYNDITIRINTVNGVGAITGAFVTGLARVPDLDQTFTGVSGTNLVGTGVGATFNFEVVGYDQTIFDVNSMQFIAPVDMFNPSEANDKYLVFPKQNILV